MLNTLLVTIVFISFSFLFSIEKVSFLSANPFSFRDIILNLDNQQEQEVFGILTLPKGIKDSDKIPLIIGVAGSLGWSEHHYEYLKMYQEMGIATFELNSFKSRGVKSTVGSQTEVTTAMMILDAYRALETLSNHPNIDINKVGLTGWSLGGGVTLFSGWKPLKESIGIDLNFSARLAFYPACFAIPNKIDFIDIPTHILIGELDTWTPADACVEFENIMKKNDYNFNVTVYDNSYHSFDRNSSVTIKENAYSFTDCRFTIRDDGAVLMNFLDIPMTTPLLQKIGLSCCAERGPKFGGNPVSRQEAISFSREFMAKHLLSE